MGVLLRPSPAAHLAPPLATRGSLHGHRRHSKLVGSFRNEVLGGQGLRSLKESTVGFKGLRVMLPPVVGAQEVEHQEVMEEEERERLGGEGFVRDLERMDLCGTSRGLCDTVIGVLGGGQLGRMLCQAGSPMGVKVAVLDPLPDCPASRIAFRHQVGSFRDTEAVREFAKDCGALTVEIEHVDVETLEALAREGVDVEPKPSTIRVIQDKYLQKMHFKQHGVALPEFMKIDSLSAAVEAGKIFGYPLMLKSRRLAYDGRGNAVAKSEEVLPVAIAALGGIERGLYVEKWAPFVKELAVIVARGRNACICSFPVVETTHKDSICHTVVSPAQVAPDIAAAAMQVAERAVGSLSGAGIFGVELFLLEDGKVLLNEVAPRPHNSGHHTIEACYVSQYEQHLRCILGLPLGDPAMRVPAAMMYNLLGEAEGEEGFAIVHETMMRAMSVPGASVHWYEKPEIRKQRKMGHITVVGPSMEVVRTRMDWIVNGKDLSQFKDEPLQTPPRSSLLPVFAVSPTTDGGSSAASGPPVSIIMGSDSDLPVMKSAAEILQSFNIPYELTVVSAHRTPERMVQFAQNAHKRGVKVIIAGAGGAAHLPGMVASMTPLPVIGVPVKGTSTDGLDSLLSIAQMPRGIPVATVAIQNATNAGLTAVRMLGVESPELDKKMTEYQNGLKEMVLEKAERLERVGWQEYLNKKYESEPLQTPPRHGSTSSLPMFADSPTTDSSSTVSAPPIGIIMGSDSDLPVMMRAAEILQLFNVPYELTVVSAHRTPERMVQYAQDARKRGVKVIIAGAGGAAHLPGMVASMTSRPVIGVPVKGSSTDGLDSLLSIVQMPRGIPVATVAIQNATNAGLLAVRVLGVENPELVKKMIEYQNGLKEMVLETAERLERVGWQEYLNTK